ncbi:hypothetical protein ASPCADRAFT_2700 [Aspergillus carbonarius ITEM 5010]|uniref:Zn(2)-C6 fungal-type domain-containing protein n=1 Tax=Aspergillus carbonarius (strain ITEM 5010) TaxID=602072 RepID=A0A1R3RXV8_ASPC5|nr:hypothetical protein ASPCADRAFT_2700 [Aspergillus carbonarius ITEM 5010]
MKPHTRRSPQSCSRCRDRHLRCAGGIPCKPCQKTGSSCSPVVAQIRFRATPRQKQSYDFSPDQTWVGSRSKRRLTYVDMTPRVKEDRPPPEPSIEGTIESTGMDKDGAPVARYQSDLEHCRVMDCKQNHHHTPREAESSRQVDAEPLNNPASADSTQLEGIIGHEGIHHQAGLSERSRYPQGPLHGFPDTNSDTAYLNWEEACLIRHFAENLAQWFETSDRDRHFALFVPERAMFCPVLRYAVFTASAGHLIRLASCRKGSENLTSDDGVPLHLNPEAAIRYHDICISHLLEISKDPREEYNEDVLTAATILRFYEQIEAPSIGNSDTYLNAIQFIVNTQRDESFYTYQNIQGPPRDSNVHFSPSVSLRHSACLSAMRQEIWSAFLHQRPFRFPVSPNNDYSLGLEERTQRWTALKAVEQRWKQVRPPAFKPIYYRARDPTIGKYFPDIWHMNACQVAGAQHVEPGRILLAVSDPARTSRLGMGAWSRSQALAGELRDITRRLCGLAVSNPPCPAAWVTAMVGISVCGEYFTDAGEQEALAWLLQRLEYDYAWPTATTVKTLRGNIT